ncbi:hypothetical protein Tco_0607066 [Tanacetum coccineum]
MKQEGLNRQIGILQKMEFDYKLMIGKLQPLMIGKLQDSIAIEAACVIGYHGYSLGNMISMKNEGTAKVNEGTAEVNESTAEKIKVPLLFVKVPLVLSDILERTACFIRYRMRVLIIPFSMRCSMLTFAITLVMCLIEDEDFVKRLRSTYILILGDDYISTSGEALAL